MNNDKPKFMCFANKVNEEEKELRKVEGERGTKGKMAREIHWRTRKMVRDERGELIRLKIRFLFLPKKKKDRFKDKSQ